MYSMRYTSRHVENNYENMYTRQANQISKSED